MKLLIEDISAYLRVTQDVLCVFETWEMWESEMEIDNLDKDMARKREK